MSDEAKFHKRVEFRSGGDAFCIIDPGEVDVYVGLSTTSAGGLGAMLIGTLTIEEAEALSNLLQEAANQAKVNRADAAIVTR